MAVVNTSIDRLVSKFQAKLATCTNKTIEALEVKMFVKKCQFEFLFFFATFWHEFLINIGTFDENFDSQSSYSLIGAYNKLETITGLKLRYKSID